MPQRSKKELIINKASELFCHYGIANTGIDQVVEHANISKKTLYSHFPTKEILIVGCLEYYSRIFRTNFINGVHLNGKSPKEKLEAVFKVFETWFKDSSFAGCLFIKVLNEYPDTTSEMHKIAIHFKKEFKNFILELCQSAESKDPENLASEIMILTEGAIINSQIQNSPAPAKTALGILKKILI